MSTPPACSAHPGWRAARAGGFVVVWASNGQDGDRGTASSAAASTPRATLQAAEFQINTHTRLGSQAGPRSGDAAAAAISSWCGTARTSRTAKPATGCSGSRFDAARRPARSGVPGEQLRHAAISSERGRRSAGPTASFIVTWNSDGQDGERLRSVRVAASTAPAGRPWAASSRSAPTPPARRSARTVAFNAARTASWPCGNSPDQDGSGNGTLRPAEFRQQRRARRRRRGVSGQHLHHSPIRSSVASFPRRAAAASSWSGRSATEDGEHRTASSVGRSAARMAQARGGEFLRSTSTTDQRPAAFRA